MALIRWIIGFILAILIAAFAVANRQNVEIYWNPFGEAFRTPLYLSVLAAMAAGFLLGATIVWTGALPKRLSALRNKARIRELEKEIETLNKKDSHDPQTNNLLRHRHG